MTWQTFFSLLAATTGLISGGWLSVGGAFSSPKVIAWMSNPPYKSTEGKMDQLTKNTAQYKVGAPLLVVSFLLQVVAALSSTAKVEDHLPAFLNPHHVVALLSLLLFLITFPGYRLAKKMLRKRVEEELEKLEKSPRLHP